MKWALSLLSLISLSLLGCTSLPSQQLFADSSKFKVSVKVVTFNYGLGPACQYGDGNQFNSEQLSKADDGRLKGVEGQ